MALARRSSQRFSSAIWPGFVDAMTGLLLVLMFVLTIFMVIQFVLQETITGQESELDALSDEVATLADALGLSQAETAALNQTADSQAQLIERLTLQLDAADAALADADAQITGFEAQVAGLLAQRSVAEATIADLETREAALEDRQAALDLALAQARDEIDAGTEAARLAAARAEALQALIADLRTTAAADTARIAALEQATQEDAARISELDAARLAEAAAAEVLRERLENADTELTAMTLALEQRRREAVETLTLLAAAEAAREDLDRNLAAALLAQRAAETDLAEVRAQAGDLDARLAAALTLQDTTAADLATARAALDDALANDADMADVQNRLAAALLAQQTATTDLAEVEARLAEALLAQEAMQAEVAGLRDTSTETAQDRADLEARLRAALSAAQTAEDAALTQTDLLAQAQARLSEEEALSTRAQRQVALLNEQVAQLRTEIATLQSLLNIAEEADREANVQIENLGAQLNTALARVAAEQTRRAALEEAERQRLEEEAARLTAEAETLERFRSNFFGQLRDVMERVDGVRIEGDRFVFSSEVLFEPGQAALSAEGRIEIAKVAAILRDVGDDIPASIDWIIRVDGHTDNLPLSGRGEFRDNWELSQARALSVVRYMQDALDIPPQRLAANGFGEYQPINPADTPEARAQNRRIELKLTER